MLKVDFNLPEKLVLMFIQYIIVHFVELARCGSTKKNSYIYTIIERLEKLM
jgi:hypothetical protein